MSRPFWYSAANSLSAGTLCQSWGCHSFSAGTLCQSWSLPDGSHSYNSHHCFQPNPQSSPCRFDQLGYTLPYKVNVADFILDIASSDVYTEERCVPPHLAAAESSLPLRCPVT